MYSSHMQDLKPVSISQALKELYAVCSCLLKSLIFTLTGGVMNWRAHQSWLQGFYNTGHL